jgi:hypothetical protein
MSTKDNWDDESSDEEGGDLLRLPPDPPKGDTPPAPLYEAQFVAEAQYDENDEESYPEEGVGEDHPEGGAWGDAPQEDYDSEGGLGEDPPDDYDDELDDYDKKLGRYVAVR